MQTALSLDAAGAAPSQRRLYIVIAATIAVVSGALLPFAQTPLRPVPEFNLFYASFVIVTDLATAFLLYGQFRASGRLPLVVLASAYFITGCTLIPHMLYFPEFASALGLLMGRPQTGAWLWHFWHIVFPLVVLLYVAAEWRAGAVVVPERATRRWVAGAVTLCLGVVVAVTLGASVFHDDLPVLHSGRTWNPITYVLGAVMGVLTLAALAGVAWVTRGRRVLNLWLMVALTAFFFDFTPNLIAAERFALGWYVGRLEAMVASGFLFVMLLTEINRLYRSVGVAVREVTALNRTLEQRVGERTALLEEANTALRQTVTEREVLIGEVYHRVNNNLQTLASLMELERRQLNDPLADEAFERIIQRVKAMALVHRRLMASQTLAQLDLQDFIDGLAEHLRDSLDFDRRNIALDVAVEALPADLDLSMRLGLLVNELVANSAKHAFPGDAAGTVRISLRRTEAERLVLEVGDDGVGAGTLEPSAGSRLVRALVTQLKGLMEIPPAAAGTLYRIEIPYSLKEAGKA